MGATKKTTKPGKIGHKITKARPTKVTARALAGRAKASARMREFNKRRTPLDIAKLAEKAKRQWEGVDSWLRKRHKEGHTATARVPPDNAAEIIYIACSEFGANISQIADLFQIHWKTFQGWRKKYPEIEEAVTSGRKVEEDKLWGVLFRQATQEGNTTAAIVTLKMKFHHRDSGTLPGQGEDTPEIIALKINAALRAIKAVDVC